VTATSSIRQSATDQDPVPACSKRKTVLTNQIVLPRDVETRVAEPPLLHTDEAPRAHAGPFRLVKPEVTVKRSGFHAVFKVAALRGLNRPGMSGDFEPWKGWSHAREHLEAVPV
jgi:hypothetical protein